MIISPSYGVEDDDVYDFKSKVGKTIRVDDVADIPGELSSPDLFCEEKGVIYRAETIKKQDFLLISDLDNVCLILSRKPQFKIKNYPQWEVKDLSYPKSFSDRVNYLQSYFDAPNDVAKTLVKRYDNNLQQAVCALKQVSFTNGKGLDHVLEPFATDTPPWPLIQAITDGDSKKALEVYDTLIFQGNKPAGVALTVASMMRSIVAAKGNDPGGLLEGKNPYYFKKYAKKLRDEHGLIKDMSLLLPQCLSSKKVSDISARSLMCALSSRFL